MGNTQVQDWEKVGQWLEKQANGLSLEYRAESLVITNPLGHRIWLYDEGGSWMVAAARWHTHFEDFAEAVQRAAAILTGQSRIVQEFKGGLMVTTWIEDNIEGEWWSLEPVYFMNPEYAPDWKLGPEESARRHYISFTESQPMVEPAAELLGSLLFEPESTP